jgi:hypothetical protein
MNKESSQTKEDVTLVTTDSNTNYKESVRKQLYQIIGTALDEETLEAAQRLAEERQKAIESLVEANKSAIKDMVEEGKKVIRARAQAAPTSDIFRTEYIDEVIMNIYKMIEKSNNGDGAEASVLEMPKVGTDSAIETELEILPPRDQDEIEAIRMYLDNLSPIISVELITMVDKSIFKVKANKTIDFIEELRPLPQVLAVEHVQENGRGKIRITLNAKSKLAKTQDEMNAKVKKLFHGKK